MENHENMPKQEGKMPTEKEAMQRHYNHYKKLVDEGKLTEEDRPHWELAQERKAQGLVEDRKSVV